MSVFNFGFQPPRSQLAKNDILVSLGRSFGGLAFTSRDVSNWLGLDFLYASKLLSRMSKRPYYLLSVVTTVARPYGGYENQYRISQRGWNKITYLRNHPAPATPANPHLWDVESGVPAEREGGHG